MSVCLLKTTKCQQGSKLLISGKVTCSLHTNQICHDATIYMLQRAKSHLKKMAACRGSLPLISQIKMIQLFSLLREKR